MRISFRIAFQCLEAPPATWHGISATTALHALPSQYVSDRNICVDYFLCLWHVACYAWQSAAARTHAQPNFWSFACHPERGNLHARHLGGMRRPSALEETVSATTFATRRCAHRLSLPRTIPKPSHFSRVNLVIIRCGHPMAMTYSSCSSATGTASLSSSGSPDANSSGCSQLVACVSVFT